MALQRRLALALAFGFLLSICICSLQAARQRALSDKLLRLHVVANSDSDEDQALKLRVRDAVLACRLGRYPTKDELAAVKAEADRCLWENGSRQRASVSLERVWFDTRVYDSFALPAGYYDAMRVVIGEGRGRNWWCVVYPAICADLASAEEELSGDELDFITKNGERYVVRFKLQELISAWARELF